MSTYGNSVDPHHVCTIQRDRIAAPYIVRVQLGDLDVLNNDVVLKLVSTYVGWLSKWGTYGARNDAKTLALDHTAATLTNDSLLGSNSDAKLSSVVVGDGSRRST